MKRGGFSINILLQLGLGFCASLFLLLLTFALDVYFILKNFAV